MVQYNKTALINVKGYVLFNHKSKTVKEYVGNLKL